jgi:hypothetical protein
MTTLMRNGRDRRSGKPVMGHAILERALLVGTRSADHIRASSHSGCIATGQASTRKTGRIHGCTRTLRRKVRFLLHRGHRPYMAHLYGPAARCKPKVMIWRSWSCASVSGLFTEPLSSWPSWISARVRSHSRLGPEGQKGHLITNALARPFSIASFRLADLGGKANSTIGLDIRFRPPPW